MRKKLLDLLFLLIVLVSFIFLSSSTSINVKGNLDNGNIKYHVLRATGSPGDRTGSPGDGGISCTACHDNTGNFNLTPLITTNIPVGGYSLGQTYLIQVTATTNGNENGRGFELTSEKTDGTNVGTFDLTGAVGSPQLILAGTSVTHSNPSFNSWEFNWTAPNTDEGSITFYAAVNAVNLNGFNSGDQVVTTQTSTTLGISEANLLSFKMFPNPSSSILTVNLPERNKDASIEIFDYTGRKVLSKLTNNEEITVDLAKLEDGLYIIKIISGDKIGVQKFIKK